MRKFVLFIYVFSILLFLVAAYFTLNGGISIPAKRVGLTHLVGWPAWLLSFAPIFSALAVGAKFDPSINLSSSSRTGLFGLFQFAFLTCCGVAGFYATKI